MNILSQKWANISYICKKCFPDFAKGYSSDNDFVNCSEISVVTWTINHVRLLQFPKKCVFTPLYCLCPDYFYFSNSGSHGRRMTLNYFQPKSTLRMGSGVITKRKKPFPTLNLGGSSKKNGIFWEFFPNGGPPPPPPPFGNPLVEKKSGKSVVFCQTPLCPPPQVWLKVGLKIIFCYVFWSF